MVLSYTTIMEEIRLLSYACHRPSLTETGIGGHTVYPHFYCEGFWFILNLRNGVEARGHFQVHCLKIKKNKIFKNQNKRQLVRPQERPTL